MLLLGSVYTLFDSIIANYMMAELINTRITHVKDTVSVFRRELLAGNYRSFERKLKEAKLNRDLFALTVCRSGNQIHIKPSDLSFSSYNCSREERSFISVDKKYIIIEIPVYYDLEGNNVALSILFTFSNSSLIKTFRTYKLLLISVFILIAFLFVIFIFYYNRLLSKPISSLFKKISDIINDNEALEDNSYKRLSEYMPVLANIKDLQTSLVKVKKELKEKEKQAAIAQTTQHLAHDIRKPFTQIKTILNAFNMFKNDPSALETAKQDVEKAIVNVQSMVDDIMDFSREVKLETSPTQLTSVLDFTIRQTMQSYPDPDITLHYSLDATKKPLLDDERASRVLANIIGNAVEAITVIGKSDTGIIDISTKDLQKDDKFYIQLIIANDGPMFPNGVEKNLFESFYTSGKKKGTGLGLASAKKIVNLHEGDIFARNKRNGNGVEFIMTFPASGELDKGNSCDLPNSSKEVFTPKKDSNKIESLLSGLSTSNNVIKVLLLEDEALYRAWVKNLINSNAELQKLVVLYDAHSVEDALMLVKSENITHAIVDIDLGATKNGFNFLDDIKSIAPNIKSLVHSNRTIKETRAKAMELGAKAFVPKPLPLESFLEFISDISIGSLRKEEEKVIESRKSPVVYYCDDAALMRFYFKNICNEYNERADIKIEFEIFERGEDLLERAREKPPTLVLTDLYMKDTGGQLLGYDVIREVKAIFMDCKAHLVSNELKSVAEELLKEAGGDGLFEPPVELKVLKDLLK